MEGFCRASHIYNCEYVRGFWHPVEVLIFYMCIYTYNISVSTYVCYKGAGGEEASLFAYEMLKLYTCFAEYKGWQFELLERSHSDVGGLKNASASVHGDGVFGTRQESIGYRGYPLLMLRGGSIPVQ